MYKVLIVEDEIAVCRGLSVLVDWEAMGFKIEGFCSDGISALHQLEMDDYDLILCDIHIPGIDGLELIHWLRGRNMNAEVIIITAYAEFDYAQRAIADGVVAYLLKPVDEVLLENAIRKAKERLDHFKRFTQLPTGIKGSEDLVGAAVAEIHNNCSTDVNVNALAKKLYISAAQLNNLFRKRFNMSVKEYVNQVRMERAKFLLKRSEKMIYEISLEVGFQDIDYFTGLFKRDTGMTPTAYRKKFRSQ